MDRMPMQEEPFLSQSPTSQCVASNLAKSSSKSQVSFSADARISDEENDVNDIESQTQQQLRPPHFGYSGSENVSSEISARSRSSRESSVPRTASKSLSIRSPPAVVFAPAPNKKEPPPVIPNTADTPQLKRTILTQLYIRICAVPRHNEFRLPLAPAEFAAMLEKVTIYNPGLLIHSRSLLRNYWHLLLSFMYLFLLFFIPICVGFEKVRLNLQPLSVLCTILFGIDNVIRCFTLQVVEGKIMPLRQTVARYCTRRLIADIITTLPFDLIFGYQTTMPWTLTLIRLLRLYDIYSIASSNPFYAHFSSWLQNIFGVGGSFISVWIFGGLLVVYLHLYACGMFLMGQITDYESWKLIPSVLADGFARQYTWGLFSAVANTFPITGFRPVSPLEQWTTIICCLVGALIYASLVGTISSFSFGLDSSGRMYKQKMDEVNEYMAYKSLTAALKTKVRAYFELKYRGKYFDEVAILRELNESLRKEITIHNCRDLIAKVNFLLRNVGDGRDMEFLGRIASTLKAVYYTQGDTIFDQGLVGNEMYFILSGTVEIIVGSKRVGALSDGAFFGEVALLGQVPRTATIRAAADTIAYRLDRSDFENILADFEDMAVRIKLVYEERMAKVRKEKEEAAAAADKGKVAIAPPVTIVKTVSVSDRV
ncbi:hypothetical protein DFS34DRAFT_310595 [Phlyctochytrium arcticum]|nr:hypothetical protein DFS34DRAFT_310595 [Phlyctochytrium arcticum]